MKIIAHWNEPDFEMMNVGGKARALGVLSRSGFNVPAWCVVRFEAVAESN